MNKQEALKQIEEQRDMILDLHGWGVFGYIKGIINQLDEPQKIELPKVEFKKSQKVTIPQFVADWIEISKQEKRNLRNALNNGGEKMRLWFLDQENYDLFGRAWLEGYEVEKEPKYTVMVKGVSGYGRYLNKALLSKEYFFASENEVSGYRTKHTRKELEDADFGWVFDCPGIKIEEVE